MKSPENPHDGIRTVETICFAPDADDAIYEKAAAVAELEEWTVLGRPTEDLRQLVSIGIGAAAIAANGLSGPAFSAEFNRSEERTRAALEAGWCVLGVVGTSAGIKVFTNEVTNQLIEQGHGVEVDPVEPPLLTIGRSAPPVPGPA